MNGLNTSTKDWNYQSELKKPTICCVQEAHFKYSE